MERQEEKMEKRIVNLPSDKTLRDEFAMAALPFFVLRGSASTAARLAYEYADAMMKEREQKK